MLEVDSRSQQAPNRRSRGYVRVARLEDIAPEGCLVVEVDGQTVALFRHAGGVFAVDNRCPHMGFPLHQGSVDCGILTCHWHHARFDLASGGTFDPWADDVRSYPVRVESGEVLVDTTPPSTPPVERFSARLAEGMKRNLSLLVAKSVIGLHGCGAPETAALTVGAEFGTQYSNAGWTSGLTILTAMANILPYLADDDRPRALYHGLRHVAQQTAGRPPAFMLDPLPTKAISASLVKTWFRDFMEVRHRDAAERILRTAIREGLSMTAVADMLFSVATDHVYLNGGHSLDFVNKAFELLDFIGWDHAEQVLPSLVPELANARRSEETSEWRRPIDLVELLSSAAGEMPDLVAQGRAAPSPWDGRAMLVESLLLDDPAAAISALKSALTCGASLESLAAAVSMAAARRIAQFRTSNEFGDWITVLHTFTYANAVEQAMRRSPSIELLRGVFDAAMSVYMDRFLNMPPAPLVHSNGQECPSPSAFLEALNTQQQVTEAAQYVANWLGAGRPDSELLATLGAALLREDAEFHSYQVVEAGFRQYSRLRATPDGQIVLQAVARYLAAHSPTSRSTGQTYQTVLRLHKGESLYAD